MQDALLNLIFNAGQSGQRAGTARVGARADEAVLELWVEDRGEGIDARNLPHLPEPFCTTRENGSGPGLAIARRAIAAHEGEVRVENRAGGGVRATPALPRRSAEAPDMVATAAKTLPNLSARSVLVLDGDTGVVRALRRVFRALGAHVRGVGTLREARLAIRDAPPDALLADLRLRDGTGLELLPEYLARQPDGAFYLITANACIDSAIEAFRGGARHYFEKPLEPIELAREIAADLAGPGPGATDTLARQLAPWLVYADPATGRALADLPHFARGVEPVLVEGESGTGKRLVARALHGLGPRPGGPFVTVRASAAPGTRPLEVLFGDERGTGSGARRRRAGLVEQADGGTLVVEEPGGLSPYEQAELSHLLETGTVRRRGGERVVPLDVRLLVTSLHPLDELVADGRLDTDLRYRLDVLHVRIPPLRERTLDIAPLARKLLAEAWRERGRIGPPPVLGADALQRLVALGWRGNVRELGNVMTRLAVTLPGGVRDVDAALLEPKLDAEAARSLGEGVLIAPGTTLAEAERLLIDAALREANCNRARAARRLGIGERTLRRKLNRR